MKAPLKAALLIAASYATGFAVDSIDTQAAVPEAKNVLQASGYQINSNVLQFGATSEEKFSLSKPNSSQQFEGVLSKTFTSHGREWNLAVSPSEDVEIENRKPFVLGPKL